MAAIFVVTALSLGLGLGLRGTNRDVAAAVVTDGQTLFYQNGDVNNELANELRALAQVSARSSTTLGGVAHSRSTAAHIDFANGGLPEVRLFQQGGPAGHVANFRNQQWRLMYITHRPEGIDPIFTFWMTGSYRTARFHSYNSTVSWNTLEIRDTINSDFTDVLAGFPGAHSSIIAPIDLPGQWQSLFGTGTGWVGHMMEGTALLDNVWIPSMAEFDMIWSTTQNHRAGTGGTSWTRTSNAHVPVGTRGQQGVFETGELQQWGGMGMNQSTSHPTRLALHLSLSQLSAHGNTVVGNFTGATTDARVGVVGSPSAVREFVVEGVDPDAGVTMRFDTTLVTTANQRITGATINGVPIGITDAAGAVSRQIAPTIYRAWYGDATRRVLYVRVYELTASWLSIQAIVATTG